MLTSTKIRQATSSYLLKIVFLASISLFILTGKVFASQNTFSKDEPTSEIITVDYVIDFSELKQIPTITFVDKNLNIVAEFYGDFEEIKARFPQNFQHAFLLNEFYNQKIFLVKSNIKK